MRRLTLVTVAACIPQILFRRNQKYQSTRPRHRNNVDIFSTGQFPFGCQSRISTSTAASNPTALHRGLASPRVEPNHWRALYRLTVPDPINCDEYCEITHKQIHFPNFFPYAIQTTAIPFDHLNIII